MRVLRSVADNRRGGTLATRLRKKRFALFEALVRGLGRPLTILDLGGTQLFWETMGVEESEDIRVVLLNLTRTETSYANFISVVGDATDLSEFGDKQFDIVFSNSVIEHVGGYEQQCRMAREIQRVGRSYFVQTPNRYFPIEPHFLFPFFQFLPLWLKVYLVRHLDLGWYGRRIKNRDEAMRTVTSIRLLTSGELRAMFPEAAIVRERFLGLTKSFVVVEAHKSEVRTPVPDLGNEHARSRLATSDLVSLEQER
jgi:hypothetical protein